MAISFEWIRNFYPSESILSWLQTKFYESPSGNWWLDFWVIPHFIFSGILRFFISNKLLAVIIFISLELIENYVFYQQNLSQYESIQNMITDVIVDYLGFLTFEKIFFR